VVPDVSSCHGCVFDFDGTIIVSEHTHMRAWEDLAKDEGLNLPAGFLEQSVGLSDHQLIVTLAEAWKRSADRHLLLARKKSHYMQRCVTECNEVPGVRAAILKLKQKGIPMTVATSSSQEEVIPVLTRLGLLDCFVRLWTVEDVSRPKPDAEIYQRAARSLGLRPNQCLAFEDSVAGVTSARGAGCSLITIQTLYPASTLGPALLSVKDFNDATLLSLLETISS
jgi:HAD superfamily hydrolase (TIGR01509 family)